MFNLPCNDIRILDMYGLQNKKDQTGLKLNKFGCSWWEDKGISLTLKPTLVISYFHGFLSTMGHTWVMVTYINNAVLSHLPLSIKL